MDKQLSVIEFEILGYKVKLREESGESNSISPHDVVDLVKRESYKIREKASHLDSGEVALLLALQFASQNLELSQRHQVDISSLKEKAGRALSLIEDISPKVM